MKFSVKPTEVTKIEADLLAVFAVSGKDGKGFALTEEAGATDLALDGMLNEVARTEDFEAKTASTLLIHTHGKIPAKRVLLVGLGKTSEIKVADWQLSAAAIARAAKKVAAGKIAVAPPRELTEHSGAEKIAGDLAIGLELGAYTFVKHKSEEARAKEKIINEVSILMPANKLNAATSGLNLGQVMAGAVIFARDLVNEPPSTTTPAYLAKTAEALAGNAKNISCEVLGKKEMTALGMNALLAIARGSEEEPKFIKLAYKGGGSRSICLVGKGITFDSGGLSLKPSEHMETMKLDMAGAAAILAIFKALSVLKPKVNVVGLISATENMPGPGAIKPGDIVKAMSGKSIEILNTDAEGRVVLSDALSYAGLKVKPDVIIDLATLTGACMVALGEEVAGMFTNDQQLGKSLLAGAGKAGEKLWELPLVTDYKELLKSPVADIKNISKSRYGGAITAALFLAEFVPEKTLWAHLDIAGPAFAEKETPLASVGGTGFGVRLIIEYLLKLGGDGLLK